MTTLAVAPACITSSDPQPKQPRGEVHQNPPEPHINPPPPETGPRSWTVYLQSDGTCEAILDVACAADARCDPPPPVAIECPRWVGQGEPVTIVETDSVCHVHPPEEKWPNPPSPYQAACPD